MPIIFRYSTKYLRKDDEVLELSSPDVKYKTELRLTGYKTFLFTSFIQMLKQIHFSHPKLTIKKGLSKERMISKKIILSILDEQPQNQKIFGLFK